MQNRIRHLLADWNPEISAPLPGEPMGFHEPRRVVDSHSAGYTMPRDINMLMPVELCINRDLLVSLLSASIREIQQHKAALPDGHTGRERAELEAVLQQQLTFRTWARHHPGSYISIAMYPVSETDTVEDLEDLGEF